MNFDHFVRQKLGPRLQQQDLKKCLDYQKSHLQGEQKISLAQVLLYGKFINPQQYSALENEYKVVIQNNAVSLEFVEQETVDLFSQSERDKTFSVGSFFKHYKIEQELGRGGMGIVFKIFDHKLNRHAALKIIQGVSSNLIKRFQQEAKAIAILDHPGIVKIFEIGESPANYFTMEYVNGYSLDHYIKNFELNEKEIITIFIKAATALQVAHDNKIIHRDLKPENIMLSKNNIPKVMDFGLAKIIDSDLSLSRNFVGTPAYASPEQVHEQKLDVCTDVYSLGATLYEALTKRRVFQGKTPVNILYQVMNAEPVAPRVLNPEISPELEAVCLKCLEKRPQKRYLSVHAFAQDLQNILDHRPITAKPPNMYSNFAKWWRRNLVVATIVTLFTAAIVLLLIFFSVQLTRKQIELSQREEQLMRKLNEKEGEISKKEELLGKKQQELQQERKNSRESLYPYVIAMSDSYLSNNNIALAEKLLTSTEYCPKYLRNWEWYYLREKSHNEVRSRKHHESGQIAINYSQKMIASLEKNRLKIWPLSLEEEMFTLEMEDDDALYGAFTNEGKYLVVADDEVVTLWNMLTKRKEKRWEFKSRIRHLAINSEDILAIVCEKRIIFFSLVTKQKIFEHEENENIRYGNFHPRRQNWLAYTGAFDKVHILDITTRTNVYKLTHPGMTRICRFSDDGKYLATAGNDSQIKIWDMKDGRCLKTLQEHDSSTKRVTKIIYGLDFSADNKYILSGGEDNVVKVWDIENKTLVRTFRGHADAVTSCSYIRGTNHIISTSRDGSMKIWDPFINGERTITMNTSIFYCDIHPEKNLIAIAAQHFIYLYSLSQHKLLQRYPCYSDARACKFVDIENRTYIVSNHSNGYIKLTDIDSHKNEKFQAFRSDVRSFDIYGNLMISEGDRSVRLFDLNSRKMLCESKFEYTPKQVTFSKDGKYFAVVGHRVCVVYDTTTQKEKHKFSIAKDTICSTMFRPFKKQIAIATGSHIAVYNFVSGEKILDIRGHKTLVKSLGFNKSGDRLVSCSKDNTVRIWSLPTGIQLLVLKNHTSDVNTVQFFGDDQYILSGSTDKNLIVWGYRNTLRRK
ncbi:WD40 repeat domain-containing serine/threonine protein kinase [Candidatus Uabimicrobium sp. HlEnr_7]|uniref:WD40 repeat domain-containing serine/threonine protein kinase n=1 Tax=Candidatus Uabimicrobium helgolandensis TaxID=3095367 RepID=UPI003558A6BE